VTTLCGRKPFHQSHPCSKLGTRLGSLPSPSIFPVTDRGALGRQQQCPGPLLLSIRKSQNLFHRAILTGSEDCVLDTPVSCFWHPKNLSFGKWGTRESLKQGPTAHPILALPALRSLELAAFV